MDEEPIKTRRRKKGGEMKPSIISLQAINLATDTAKLKHQNRQLYTQVKLIQRRHEKCLQDNRMLQLKSNNSLKLEVVLLNQWQTIITEISRMLGISGQIEQPRKKMKLEHSSNGSSPAMRNIYFLMAKIAGNEESFFKDPTKPLSLMNELDREEPNFAKVEDEILSKSNSLLILLKELEAHSEKFKPKEISNNADVLPNLKTALQRILFLEESIQSLNDKYEDLEAEFNIAVTRLNQHKSLEFLPENELLEIAVKSEESHEKSKDETSSIPSEGVKSDLKKEEDLREEVEDLKSISTSRLQEISQLKTAKEKAFSEIEMLKAEVMSLNSLRRFEDNLDAEVKASVCYKALEKELQETKCKRDSLKEALIISEHNEADAKEKLNLYENKVEQLDVAFANKYLKELHESKDKYRELHFELYTLQKKHSQLKARSGGNTKMLKRMEDRANTERDIIFELKKENHRLQHKVSKLKQEQKKNEDTNGSKVSDVEKQSVEDNSKEIESILKKLREANKKRLEYQKELKGVTEKHQRERESNIKSIADLQVELKKVILQQQTQLLELDQERAARKVLLGEKTEFLKELRVVKSLQETSKENYQEVVDDNQALKLKLDQQASELEALRHETNNVKQKISNMVNRNVQLQKSESEAMFLKNRISEENAALKRKLERTRDRGSLEGNAGLRLNAMEAALRCPVNTQKWKSAMLLRCSHAFAKATLNDALENRNRKCPTCKTPFSKDDIIPLFLYQENSDDEE